MLTIVLILMAVFAATASSYLPPAREPSVTIRQDVTGAAVILHHKGGDAVPKSELRITVGGLEKEYSLYVFGSPWEATEPDSLFDLGGNITFTRPDPGSTFRLSTSRVVLYSGVVP